MKKEYQNALKVGALHGLWSCVILGTLAANVYFGPAPWSWATTDSWTFIRGLGVAALSSVMVGMLAAYKDKGDFIRVMGWAAFLPLLTSLALFHAGWLIYSVIVWQWHYDYALFLYGVLWSYACIAWGLWSFIAVPFLYRNPL
ncbi:hypothetical protein ACFSFZ_08110 [Mixta tenebrionis]|jgi:hypothetical protein|uniref:Uncharacterized protein n=2 Tax=Mixta TaxID=2100764 RepID=A0A6P1Q3M8_9GAMM|nr:MULTISPECIES: hypothetical protein [Mixta]QHM72659.1 hypothetical protein C7M51_02977 [Mixta intestinalis]TPW40880.1 hypothetical protein FKM52_17015 [Mixta tenebrionis]